MSRLLLGEAIASKNVYTDLSGPFSYTMTALVVEACKLGLSFYCGVSNANCIVNIAITVNFEWVPVLSSRMSCYLYPWVSMWLLIDIWIFKIPIFSLITSLDETRVMIGVYTMIGLSFAPNAFEYYQVIPNVIMNSQITDNRKRGYFWSKLFLHKRHDNRPNLRILSHFSWKDIKLKLL